LGVGLVSDLDPCGVGVAELPDGNEMYLVVEPESAGYVVLGPTLRLLEGVHPRLPLTFFNLLTHALNRWVRVYDYRDAAERVEQLREWYEGDPEGETVELPDVDGATPKCLRGKWNQLKERFVEQLLGTVRNRRIRALLAGVLTLSAASRQGERPRLRSRSKSGWRTRTLRYQPWSQSSRNTTPSRAASMRKPRGCWSALRSLT